jgi:hypothetical protein
VVKLKCLTGLCGQTNSGGRVSAGHGSVWYAALTKISLAGVPVLLLFFFSLGQERELSDVSE